MVEKIKNIKDQFLELMEKDLAQKGAVGANIKFHGELADIVKDLAEAEKSCWEAEYYRTVIEAMGTGEQQFMGFASGGSGGSGGGMGFASGGAGGSGGGGIGFASGGMGGGGGGRRGYGGSPANGGNLMGHGDPVSAIRDMMMTADPETKMRIRNELGMM